MLALPLQQHRDSIWLLACSREAIGRPKAQGMTVSTSVASAQQTRMRNTGSAGASFPLFSSL